MHLLSGDQVLLLVLVVVSSVTYEIRSNDYANDDSDADLAACTARVT